MLFDDESFQLWLTKYKKAFNSPVPGEKYTWWEGEREKWIAVKHFQDHWDIDATDFYGMLEASLAKKGHFLDRGQPYSKRMILIYAEKAPEELRKMFKELFDESRDIFERIEQFKQQAISLKNKLLPPDKQSGQDEKAITTYLWLRYPEKYYLYKITEVAAFAHKLKCTLPFKQKSRTREDYMNNLRNFFELYEAVNMELLNDGELRDILNYDLDAECYPDPHLNTLTVDFGFYVSRNELDSTNDSGTEIKSDEETISEKSISDNSSIPVGHWWLNANPKIWSFAESPIGEVQSYTLYNENGNKRRIFQNFLDVKPGDVIIGYESNPIKQIVALGEIVSSSDGKEIAFKKTETLTNPVDYKDLKELPDLQGLEFFVNPNGSLFKIDSDEYDVLMDIIRESNPKAPAKKAETYGLKNFLDDVFLSEDEFKKLDSLLRRKRNLILQGAPGTGKTFTAKRLAYALMEAMDNNRIELVQFHQNYSYEDFVRGYRPTEDGFELEDGIFFRFCQKASNYPDEPFFFIIDEINRGNLSKVFGELLMLIESGHRGEKATLAYDGYRFDVPKNVFIIGMMNTADRSLAMIDYALRRRFAFFEMAPAFDSPGFSKEIEKHGSETLRQLVAKVIELNKVISADPSLGRGFQIGHSYFCDLENASKETLLSIVDYEIIPMLEEYWFDDESKVQAWSQELRAAIDENA